MAMLRAALYCRLSKDDMLQGDSESIKTQKAMLTQYAKEHGFLVVEIYVDDGYSGLNFDRPSFNRMLDDIEAGIAHTHGELNWHGVPPSNNGGGDF